MKKNVILSIKPEFVAEIKAGRKCFEFRKTIFKEKVEKVYIYASTPISKVVGEFQPVDILSGPPQLSGNKPRKRLELPRRFMTRILPEDRWPTP